MKNRNIITSKERIQELEKEQQELLYKCDILFEGKNITNIANISAHILVNSLIEIKKLDSSFNSAKLFKELEKEVFCKTFEFYSETVTEKEANEFNVTCEKISEILEDKDHDITIAVLTDVIDKKVSDFIRVNNNFGFDLLLDRLDNNWKKVKNEKADDL